MYGKHLALINIPNWSGFMDRITQNLPFEKSQVLFYHLLINHLVITILYTLFWNLHQKIFPSLTKNRGLLHSINHFILKRVI